MTKTYRPKRGIPYWTTVLNKPPLTSSSSSSS